MNRVISIDTETYYDEDCTVQTLAPEMYTRHPKFDCYMVSVCDGAETWVGHPRDFNWDALTGATLTSHNAAFDKTIYESLVRDGKAPKVLYRDWHCTANLSAYLCSRRSLGEAVPFFFKQDISKDMRSWMKGRTWQDAISLGKDKDMLEYARRDAYWCWKLWNDLSLQWPEHERRLSNLTIDSGRRGVMIDLELLQQYLLAVQSEIIRIESALPWIESGLKPTSPKAVAEQCRKEGIPCPPVKTHDEEGFVEWENTYSKQFSWVKGVSDWRSANKLLATLETIKARLRPDGTIEAPLKYFGAHTGRWSGESGLNFQNFRKVPLVCAGIPIDIRKLIIARPGKKFIMCDAAQIEPRVLAWLSGNTQLLEMIRTGMSIYEAFARVSMGWTGGNLKKENPDKYQLSKIQVLGLGYGCGWEKFITIAAGYDVTLSEAQSREIVTNFREQNPRITSLWGQLDSAFKRSVGDGEFITELPSGRNLTYRNVRNSWRVRTDRETGEVKKERAVVADVSKSGRIVKQPLYGGLLCENLVQATARDVFAEHLLHAVDAGLTVAFTVHDEGVFEVDQNVKVADVEAVMGTTPEWLPGCPIAAEGSEGLHYKK